MCLALDDWAKEEQAKGEAVGLAKGITQGIAIQKKDSDEEMLMETINHIMGVMENFGVTFSVAADTMNINEPLLHKVKGYFDKHADLYQA